MANIINNISIKNKIIFGLLFSLLISVGIGIVQYNKIVEIHNSLTYRKQLRQYQADFNKLQLLYSNLDAIVVRLVNTKYNDDFIKNSNQFRTIDMQIISILTEIENQELNFVAETPDLVNTTVQLNDSLRYIRNIYEKDIEISIAQITDYKFLFFHPEKVRADYKRLVEEQNDIGVVISNYSTDDTDIDEVVKELLDVYDNSILTSYEHLNLTLYDQLQSIQFILSFIQDRINEDQNNLFKVKRNTVFYSGIFMILALILILLISFLINKSVVEPLKETNNLIINISKGKFPDKIQIDRSDEIGLIRDSLNGLVTYIKETSDFAHQISVADFDSKFFPSGSGDILGNSLIQLRESLLHAKKEEEERKNEDFIRSRTAEGLAIFNDILQKSRDNLDVLGRDVISSLVKFLNCNQGVIFILNDENENFVHLELLAAYAWNREKFIDKKLQIGEGLIGAVAQEKFTVYMTDVPEDYIEIKSGTGATNPTSIIIVPLKINNEVLGVIEVASFKTFDKYEIKLVETIAESIASTLKSVRISAQTATLLEKSQLQAAELQEQEHVMRETLEQMTNAHDERRKNEEYMRTTIREMEDGKKQLEYKRDQQSLEIIKLNEINKVQNRKIHELKQKNINILEAFVTAVILINKSGTIEFANKSAEKLLKYERNEIVEKNIEKFILIPEDEIANKSFYNYLLDNKSRLIDHGQNQFFIVDKEGNKKMVVLEMIEDIENKDDVKLILFIKDMSLIISNDYETQRYIDGLIKSDIINLKKIEKYEDIFYENNIPIEDFIVSDTELIKWSDKLELGVNLIDNQHKRLVKVINTLYSLIISKASEADLTVAYKKLVDYSEYHFGFEEKYMDEFGFEDKEDYKLLHYNFLNKLENLFKNYIDNSDIAEYKLIHYLYSWVYEHVVSDGEFVLLFKSHGIK